MGSKMIYLDNAATSKPHPKAMLAQRFCEEQFYNPSALYAKDVREKISSAREFLLSAVAGEDAELIFTSGGTEADNFAVFGGARRGNAVTTAGEHAAVYQSFLELKNRGVEPRFAPIDETGKADFDRLLELVDEKTSLVSVVHVNNETGAVNEIERIAEAVKKKNPRCLFASDGVQAFGKIPFRMTKNIDLYAISAHKIGGMKGTGGLIKRKGAAIPPLIWGGGQEGNLRSGTENVGGILAFSAAAQERFRTLRQDFERILRIRESVYEALKSDFVRLSPQEGGSPYILSVAAEGVRGEILQRLCEERGVIVGTGSACSSKKPFSRVIEACGIRPNLLYGVLRLSFSAETTEEEALLAAQAITESVRELKTRMGIWKK